MGPGAGGAAPTLRIKGADSAGLSGHEFCLALALASYVSVSTSQLHRLGDSKDRSRYVFHVIFFCMIDLVNILLVCMKSYPSYLWYGYMGYY